MIRAERVNWIDIFKAIAIIFMVMGHSNMGVMVQYVYEFHMAAFFFISGFTYDIYNKNLFKTFYDKFLGLIMPFVFIFFILLIGVKLLEYFNNYHLFFNGSLPKISTIISTFLTNGDSYVLWLGAGWFITVLFGIFIFHKSLYVILGKKVSWFYGIVSFLFFLYGYSLVGGNIRPRWWFFQIDLICIGQFYFYLGILLKKSNIFNILRDKNKFLFPFLLLSTIGIWFFNEIIFTNVDYPSRKFNLPFQDIIAAFNGIIFCFSFSALLEKYLPKVLKEKLIYVGKNTFSIVVFHFMIFDLIFLVLYKLGYVDILFLKNFTPTPVIGGKIWYVFVFAGITFSILFWNVLAKINVFNFLLGKNREMNEKLYKQLTNFKFLVKLDSMSLFEYGFSTEDYVKKKFLKFRNFLMNEDKLLMYMIIAIVILVFVPLAIPKIICNDELISRFWSLNGRHIFYDYFLNDHIQKGRALSTYFVTTSMYAGFLGVKYGVYRIIPALTIILTSFLFSIFLYKLLKKKFFSIFVGILILVFLPITFEATSPNSFTALYNIPFAFLIFSFIQFLNYLERGNKKYFFISMALFFLTLVFYEVFVTYTPLFVFLLIYKKGLSKGNFKQILKTSLYPIGVSILFLGLYVYFSKKFPSNYNGNQIGGFTIMSSFLIVKQLVLSSFPGYYLFNAKYIYLTKLFSNNMPIWQIISLKSILVSTITTSVLWITVHKGKIKQAKLHSKDFLFLFGIIFFMVVPNLPWAVSKMYQEKVNNKDFIALPVTYFNYFFTILFLCYACYLITSLLKSKVILKIVIVFIGFFVFLIQVMNNVILKKQLSEYQRIVNVEKMLNTDFIKNMNHHNIYSKDLYETRLSMAIHKNYWTQYTKYLELDLTISDEEEEQDMSIDYINNEYFIIRYKKYITVVSPKKKNGSEVLVKCNDNYRKVKVSNGVKDNGMYLYEFIVNRSPNKSLSEEVKIINIPYNSSHFYDELYSVGANLSSCIKLNGFWDDHWVTNESTYKIRSGNKGEIKLKGYYSEEISEKKIGGGQKISCYIESTKVKEFIIDNEHFEFTIPCKKNSIIELKIISNFSFIPNNGDKRNLAFVLDDLLGN